MVLRPTDDAPVALVGVQARGVGLPLGQRVARNAVEGAQRGTFALGEGEWEG